MKNLITKIRTVLALVPSDLAHGWDWHWRLGDQTTPGSITSLSSAHDCALLTCPRFGEKTFAPLADYLVAVQPDNIQQLLDECEVLLARTQQFGWIPVTDRFPKSGDPVMAVVLPRRKNSNPQQCHATFWKTGPGHCGPDEWVSDGDTITGTVTHWLECPPMPES